MSAKSRYRPRKPPATLPTTPPSTAHPRVTPDGQALGEQLVRLTEPVIQRLAREGEPDTRCASCAFRAGTVPNGCPQTTMDAIKAVMEGVLFTCHMHPPGAVLCHGWYAARVAVRERAEAGVAPIACSWEFSPPDPERGKD